MEEQEDEEEEEEYDEEEDEEGEESPKSEGKPQTRRNRGPSIAQSIAQKYSNHKSNKKSFMSTAPLSAFIPKQPQGHYLGSIKPNLKVKETKAELKQYKEKLETALTQIKRKAADLERDCERINKEYMKEVRRGEKKREMIAQFKAALSNLIQ